MHDTSFDFRRPDDAPKQPAAAPAEEPTEKLVSGSVNYALHPLVVINISDHHTRVTAQRQGSSSLERVFGILLGEQSGRRVELANSFEIKVTTNGKGAWVQLPPLSKCSHSTRHMRTKCGLLFFGFVSCWRTRARC